MRVLGRTCFLLLMYGGIITAQTNDIHQSKQHQTAKVVSDTARLEWERHLGSNSASSTDFAVDVATDAGGFVYVTGKSESPDADNDYLTIKYSASGQEIWRARYDGPAHADDVPSALAVDATGNVYVTGMSIATGTSPGNYDYATVKYNSGGNQEWVARYGVPGLVTDAAVAIAVDATGNVFVTGESDFDIATVKYNDVGVQQWVARYSGTGSIPYTAAGLVVDASGNVFVAGGSFSTGWDSFPQDFIAIKYAASGVEQWTTHIALDSSFGSVAGIVLDNSGGVYIAGSVQRWSQWSWWGEPSIVIAKFDSTGQQHWIAYDTSSVAGYLASSLAIDPAGNVIVAGVEGVGVNWFWGYGHRTLIMKYSATGDLLWSRDHEIGFVRVSEMVLDHAGNIYFTGSRGNGSSALSLMGDSIITMKYDTDGTLLWTEYYRGVAGSENKASGIAVDDAGNIVVAGGSGTSTKRDFVTITYLSSGAIQRDAYASGVGSSYELVSDMALDAAGNVYITGSSLDANSSYDYFTAKFNPQGDQLWKTTYNGPANSDDRTNAIVLDRVGNVYVTGSSEGVGTLRDWATIKYNSSGIQQWVARYNGQSNQNDDAHLIVVDSALNVYVAGATAASSRLTTTKYNPSGVQQWSASYDSANFVAMPGGLRVDKNGNVYVTNPQWYWADAIAFKYNSLGNEVWRVFGGNDLLVDDSANVYVSGANMSGWTNKYNSTGALIWHVGRGGTSIEFDNFGDILFHNIWTISTFSGKITKGGTVQWLRGDSPADWAFGFCVDGVGNSYVSGYSLPTFLVNTSSNYSAKISPTGSVQWLAEYSSENSLLVTQACQVDASGNLYVAGTSQRDDFSNVATILKYAQVTVSVGGAGSEVPESYSLSQNYPNPFNPSTTIRFALPKSGHVELKIYNTLGQEVATLINEEKIAGTYSAQWNAGSVASGVYFYRLKAGEYNETKKLLLMK